MSEISATWVAWITENLLRGGAPADIQTTLVQQGLDPSDAAATVKQVLSSGELMGARAVLQRSAGVEQAARLRRHFERLSGTEVEALDEATFFHGFWSAHRPVLFKGAAKDWHPWSLDSLEHRFGEVEIEVLEGRSSDPRWWVKREQLRRTLPLGELIRRMRSEVTDDVYGVGRNDVLEALPELRDEIGDLPGIGNEPAARLWIGPQGTRTPLHHDQSAAWLVQRVGTKRVWLASPLEAALFDTADGVFNRVDPRDDATGDLAEVHWWELVIEPGDAVFLPAGWWHQVIAESASVSLSLGGFKWANRFTWYAPGRFQHG